MNEAAESLLNMKLCTSTMQFAIDLQGNFHYSGQVYTKKDFAQTNQAWLLTVVEMCSLATHTEVLSSQWSVTSDSGTLIG